MEMYIFYAGCIMILLSVIFAFVLRWYLVRYTNNLTECLDQMIAGRREIAFAEEQELLMGKVQVKLRQLYEILQSRTDKSIHDREVLEEIISDISHQIKLPIANIRTCQSILQNREMPVEQRREFLRSVDKQTEKLDTLMQSMIEMSQMEVGMITVEPIYQTVYPLVEQAVCQIAMKAEQKQIEIQIDCPMWIKAVYDRKWTAEALENILDNAVKYTEEHGQIGVSVSVTDFFVKVEVADNGIGIAEEEYTDIFRRFSRGKSVQQEEGVGIGLYLAKEIVRKQKGYIGVASEEGAGSSFSIYLPAET